MEKLKNFVKLWQIHEVICPVSRLFVQNCRRISNILCSILIAWLQLLETLILHFITLMFLALQSMTLHCTALRDINDIKFYQARTKIIALGWNWVTMVFFGQTNPKIHCSPGMHNVQVITKLDRVGPVDNRPSTDKLHHFVRKKERKKNDMWHVTCDMWHVTRDMSHVTRDTWLVWGVNILSKFQLPSFYCLWFMILWRSGGKGWLSEAINQWMTRLFIEQPRLHWVC